MRGELCSMRLNESSILKTGHHLFPEASAQAEPHLATIAKRFSAMARAMSIRDKPIVPGSPWQNGMWRD
jgi:hypothetical protein